MLEDEGFTRSGLIDIFDGGPTVTAPRDHIRTIRNARSLPVPPAQWRRRPTSACISSPIPALRVSAPC
jgi:arginine/ornithine N-succinyltransferase beta subunit